MFGFDSAWVNVTNSWPSHFHARGQSSERLAQSIVKNGLSRVSQ
jgi:hypothetical protein